jgi:AcrR family transcriptional regulator
MSPRPYRLGQRQATTDQTRARIIAAAREMIMTNQGFSEFTVDAVARQADVARMTVYNQFGSKTGLLEALCDTLAAYGGMDQMASAFRQPDAFAALDDYVTILSRFWDSDRIVTRRLRALAALDPDLTEVVGGRDERRRRGTRVLVQRLIEQHGRPRPDVAEEMASLLFTLLSFESFDTLAGSARTCQEVAPLMQRLVRHALDLPDS